MTKDFSHDMEFEDTNGIFLVGSMLLTNHQSDMLNYDLEKLAKEIMLKDMGKNMPSYVYPCTRTRPEVQLLVEDAGKKRKFVFKDCFFKNVDGTGMKGLEANVTTIIKNFTML